MYMGKKKVEESEDERRNGMGKIVLKINVNEEEEGNKINNIIKEINKLL